MTSLPARERGLKRLTADIGNRHAQSHFRPLPYRGGKLTADIGNRHAQSLPARERGLKRFYLIKYKMNLLVAPRAGAWIET